MKLTFEIEPVEQARPRATRMGKGIRLYDPKKVSVYKKQLAIMCQFQYKKEPLTTHSIKCIEKRTKITSLRNTQTDCKAGHG